MASIATLKSSAIREGRSGCNRTITEATAGLVEALPSFGKARFGPYILAGGGALVFSPRSNSLLGEETQAKERSFTEAE